MTFFKNFHFSRILETSKITLKRSKYTQDIIEENIREKRKREKGEE